MPSTAQIDAALLPCAIAMRLRQSTDDVLYVASMLHGAAVTPRKSLKTCCNVLHALEGRIRPLISPKPLIILAHRAGFEPTTPRFVVWCSIQLSYRCLPLLAKTAGRHGRRPSAGWRSRKVFASRRPRSLGPYAREVNWVPGGSRGAVVTGSGPLRWGPAERAAEPRPQLRRPGVAAKPLGLPTMVTIRSLPSNSRLAARFTSSSVSASISGLRRST